MRLNGKSILFGKKLVFTSFSYVSAHYKGKENIAKFIVLLLSVCAGILLVSCITAIDGSLPYQELPVLTVGTEFNLVASPAHPTSYLSNDAVAAGETVQMIGADQSAAWLLVMHNNQLGWMPSIYSRTNVATLKPAIIIEPLSAKCARYLGASFTADETWTSTMQGAAYLIGSIYLPKVSKQFENASLTIEIVGEGTVYHADYLHISLTANSRLVLFSYSLNSLQKGSQLRLNLHNAGNDPYYFQLTMFSRKSVLM